MSSGDTRKDLLVATTGNYFGIQSSDSVLNDVRSSKELNIFLDDGNSPVLAAKYDTHQGHKSIKLSNNVEPSDTAEKVLVFFKLQPKAITPDNIHQNVFVSSMLSSPVNTLYHFVQKVFAPLLFKDEDFDPKLQSLLSELEAGLGSVVRKQDSSLSSAANLGDNIHQNVFVSSMLSSPVNTLYHFVQKVFAPLLFKDEDFDPKLQSLLSELEAGLGSVVRKQDSSLSSAANLGDEDNVGGILTPQDEFQYWSAASICGYDLSERERASFFQESFLKGKTLGHKGHFPFSQNFRNFRFSGKWNTFRRFVPLENSQKK